MVSVDVDMKSFQLPASSFQQTLNDVPQPHVDLAFGLLKMNPLLTRLVS